MEYRDYVILFDENGQPYIAHSWKSAWGKVKSGAKRAYGAARSGGSKAHKYLMKVGEGAKAKYAYTKEEVDALLGRGRRAASKAMAGAKSAAGKASSGIKSGADAVKRAGIKAADKLGVDDRIRANKTNEIFQNNKNAQTFIAKQDAKEAYEATPLGKAEGFLKRAGDIAKRYGSMTLGAIKSTPGKVADKLGFDERQRLKEAEEATENDKYNPRRYHERAAARAEYENTALGKAEGAARKAGAAAKAAAGKVKDAAKDAARETSEKLSSRRASQMAKRGVGSAAMAAQVAGTNKDHSKAISDYNTALKEYNKVKNTIGEDHDSAYWALVAAEREYERVTGRKPPKN